MAAESGGNDNQNDGYNWALLSHSHDHRINRRGQGGQNRNARGRRGTTRGRHGMEKGKIRNEQDVKMRDDVDASFNRSNHEAAKGLKYYEKHVAEYGTTDAKQRFNSKNYGIENDSLGTQFNDNVTKSSRSGTKQGNTNFKKGRQHNERNYSRRGRTGTNYGKVTNHQKGDLNSQTENIKDNESKSLQTKKAISHKSDQESNSLKGEIIDGKYIPNKSKNGRSNNDRYDEDVVHNAAKSDYFRGHGRKEGIEKNKQRRTYHSRRPIDSEQARVLIEQLIEESYECMVCCDYLRSSQASWCCQNCYHIFHLKCIKKWVRSSSATLKGDASGWRCPGCQNVTEKMPSIYTCFCGTITSPEWNPRNGVIPHSCGEVCKKQRTIPPCHHLCNELCHPGPCPSCPVMVTKECPCGSTRTKMRCGQTAVLKCKNVCKKLLNCGKHSCDDLCHEGSCNECDVIDDQYCFCGKEERQRTCGADKTGVTIDEKGMTRYQCAGLCSRTLDCGNHICSQPCHPGPCKSCEYLPSNVEFCPCKQTRISDLLAPDEQRQSCLDPVPCCDNFCGKRLKCGSPGNEHYCKMKCHTGSCIPCDGVTLVKCRCGSSDTEIPCKEYNPDQAVLCERRCNKKRKCGRHRCNQKCCLDFEHNCPLICGRKLTCGLHKCDELCHQGNCPRCWQTNFEERTCYCGQTVQYPPIPCGAPLPHCSMQCTRMHPCSHEPQHNCHYEDRCPPCVVLMEKQCLCGKETRKSVPCHLNNISCGLPCEKELPCKIHKCLKVCHKGECLSDAESCQQPCTISRRDCPHPCGAPCHIGEECPEGPCKSQIIIKCKCGRKSEKVFCLAGNSTIQFHRLSSQAMGDRLRNLKSGQSIDISDLIVAEKRRGMDCDEECAIYERNRRLADALGIDNPEATTFTTIQFSNALKDEAKNRLPFVKTVEEAIEDLIHKVKKSSLSQITHSFPPMSSSHRKLIHEIAEHYNCKTVSYDPEPKRNTVVTATKESVLVNTRLSTVIERKVNKTIPNPVLLFDEQPLNFQGVDQKTAELKRKEKPAIDYFDDDFD